MIKYVVKPKALLKARSVFLGETRRGDRALIGELAEVGPSAKLFLSLDFEHVVGIFGKRGSGKSHLLGSLMEALAWKECEDDFARVTIPRGAIMFDVLNIFQWMGRNKSLPIGITLFHVPGYAPPNANSIELRLRPQDLNPDDWCMLLGIDGIREPMGQVLNEAVVAARTQRANRLADLIRIVGSFGQRFSTETIRAVSQRLNSYAALGLFDDAGVPLASLCQKANASIILFAGVPEDIRSLYVFLILRRVYEERVKSSQVEKEQVINASVGPNADLGPATAPRMWLFIDEAQNIFPARNTTYAVDMLVRYVREGRNYGLSLCFTTQQPASVDSRIMAQMDTIISFVLTVPSDLSVIQQNLKSPAPTEITRVGKQLSFQEAVRSLAVGQCVVSNIDAERTYFMMARERLTAHGGFET